MQLYSKQLAYCNACGLRMEVALPNVMGRAWRCCSIDCVREMQWRETLSIMGKPYMPHDAARAAKEGGGK
jgi:hypothetical protein